MDIEKYLKFKAKVSLISILFFALFFCSFPFFPSNSSSLLAKAKTAKSTPKKKKASAGKAKSSSKGKKKLLQKQSQKRMVQNLRSHLFQSQNPRSPHLNQKLK